MTVRLDQLGYERTKTKLEDLEARLAAIAERTDLEAIHKQRVIASYKSMKRKYLEEMRLFEAQQSFSE